MQSDEPADHSHFHGLNSPFEFVPPSATSRDEYGSPISRHSYLDDAVRGDPDDFYRPFAERPSHPDIIVNPYDDNEDAMSSGTKRKTPHLNGSTPKSSVSPVSAAGRSTLRSASGPATPLSAAKSTPSLSTSARTQNGSIKDRIKQLEQARGGSPARGGARGGRGRAASTSKLSSASASSLISEPRTPRGGHGASRQRGGKGITGRPLLFGEIVDTEATEDDAGFGISSVTRPHTDEMEGSMHHPNPMFAHSRSYSMSEASADPESVQTESPIDPSYNDVSGSHILSPSRIPVKTRRASDLGPLNGAVTPPATVGAELSSRTLSPQQAGTAQQKSRLSATTPPGTLSSRRYSPKKPTEPSQSLNAYVKAPPQKLSPTLRSSRPRQPVSSATTSASRAKVSERYVKPGSSSGSGSENVPPNARRTNPKAIPGVDVAARRAKLQNKFQAERAKEPKAAHDKPNVLKKKANEGNSDQANDQLPMLEPVSYQPHRDVPELSLNTADAVASGSEPQSSTTDTPHTDIDESPVLGEDNSYPSSASQSAQDHNLLRQVMEIRHRSTDTTPRTQHVDDFLSEKDDAETIQVLLGATPVLPEANWKDPDTPSEVLSPIPDQDEDEGGFLDNRSSLRPDDSVSVVFRQNYRAQNETAPPVPPMPASVETPPQGYTLDGDARSQINWILDRYRSGFVTPDMAYEFQRRLEEVSPELPQHDAWESTAATQSYLQSILDFYFPSVGGAEQGQRGSIHQLVSPITDDNSPEDGEPGVAIIYGATQRYSRDSISSIGGSVAQHSHTASNSTLRPTRSEEEGRETPPSRNRGDSKPLPPPKGVSGTTHQYFTGSGPYQDGSDVPQIPQFPETSLRGDGLGLTVDTSRPMTPSSPHPPAPNHAPPPPPTPKFDSAGSSNRYYSPISPSVYSRDPFVPGHVTSSPPKSTRSTAPVDSVLGNDAASAKTSAEISRPGDSRAASLDAGLGAPNGTPTTATPYSKDSQLKRRHHVVKELIDTENKYAQDMTVLEDIFMGTSSPILSDADRKILFGNLSQVRALSVEILDDLKRGVSSVYIIPRENRWNHRRGSVGTFNSNGTENSPANATNPEKDLHALDYETSIGKIFLERLPRMEKVFGDWIKNQSAANTRYKELKETVEVKLWLDECLASAKDIITSWDLDSMTIKPTQRITKYTLLLGELIKYTPSDHPDYAAIKTALEEVTNAIHRINEAARRAELVSQAMNRKRKDPESKIKVGKLLNRRAEKLKQQVGFTAAANDQSYEAIAQKFGGHFFQLQIVMRDIEKYLEDLQESIGWLTSFTRSLLQFCQVESHERFPEYESSWIRFGQAMNDIFDIALSDHTKNVRKLVIDPILTLWKLHEGPQKMMQKRKKRLVDHVRYKALIQRKEKPDKRLQLEEDQFQAVNDTLKEELPKLYMLTKKLVEACLTNFIDLQAQWMDTWKRKTSPFVDNSDRLLPAYADIGHFVAMIQSTFNQDSAEWEARVKSLAICNGATLADAQNFLSPATTWTQDDGSSFKRPSTMGSSRRTLSIDSEQAQAHYTPASSYRISGNMGFTPSPLLGSFPLPDGLSQGTGITRTRASSAMSSRGPSTPHSLSAQYVVPGAFNAPRPSTASERHTEMTSTESSARPTVDFATAQELEYETNFMLDQDTDGGRFLESPEDRYSGIFQSALPMSDSPPSSSPHLAEDNDARVLFLAASLFEFNIDGSRREAGYPYLRYVPGEASYQEPSDILNDLLTPRRSSTSSARRASSGLPATKTTQEESSAGSGRSTLRAFSQRKSDSQPELRITLLKHRHSIQHSIRMPH